MKAGRVFILIAALALIIAGTASGGIRDTAVKAGYICLECIGIG